MRFGLASRRILTGQQLNVLVAVVVVLVLLAAPLGVSAADDHHQGRGFDHVFVIMMENTGYDTLIGNPNAPFINFAAATTGLAANYYGVAHPSQPNYIGATSGALNGVFDDNDITIDVPNIVDQLESRGKSWKAYMQSYSLCSTPLDHACGNQLYERKHNPFISYKDVQTNAARVGNIVDYSQFATDLANNHVADYVWISPDQCNDMHGRGSTPDDLCDFSQVPALISAGDSFLLHAVNAIMTSKAWRGNCDANPGGGHVVGLVILSRLRFTRISGEAFNHYSMLATIQKSWRLGCLGNTCDRRNVKPMTELTGLSGGL